MEASTMEVEGGGGLTAIVHAVGGHEGRHAAPGVVFDAEDWRLVGGALLTALSIGGGDLARGTGLAVGAVQHLRPERAGSTGLLRTCWGLTGLFSVANGRLYEFLLQTVLK